MMVQIGRPAPAFEAQAYAKGKFINVKLADYAGKWVLLFFYPADFTFVCPTELAAVATIQEELSDIGVQTLTCSIDTIFSHKMWDETELSKLVKGGIPYPMLWDVGGNIGRMYGVYDEKSGLNGRGVFIIDPDGNVQALEVTANPLGRNFDETLRKVRALQHIRKTNEAAPAGWQPGDQTLKPGAELVGHVCEIWKPKK